MTTLPKFVLVVVVLAAAVNTHAQEKPIEPGTRPGVVTGAKKLSDPQSWSRYTVEGEEFSVILPTLPAMTTTKAMRKRDHEYQLQRQIETSIDGLLYTVEVYENPKPQQSLDEFISELKDNVKCNPDGERTVTVDGYSGKECSSSDKDYPAIVQFLATRNTPVRLSCERTECKGRTRPEGVLLFHKARQEYRWN